MVKRKGWERYSGDGERCKGKGSDRTRKVRSGEKVSVGEGKSEGKEVKWGELGEGKRKE
jgi:hypothetical protein